jgi:hypothetical protein
MDMSDWQNNQNWWNEFISGAFNGKTKKKKRPILSKKKAKLKAARK